MNLSVKASRNYLALVLLFIPALAFAGLLVTTDWARLGVSARFPFLPWQFWLMAVAGSLATYGGVADWRYHRNPLNMQLSSRERDAEAFALGAGGLPMFGLMWLAMTSPQPTRWLVPIVVVLLYTVVAICYDEFVFHRKRCGPVETRYHRLLVFGNGVAWLAWFEFIFC
ncbi:hypothetical protein MON38_03995 [Hymenobacter sp. DH14]|uniref:Uncharacterized protein n=1 Tax=Hymenobacter cyanobacteriorum TaxID=2926463 RepID=A0A9X1VD90_9BACT|nr:hypothetical protein [Hymenobacter cyanobacteriorum]MCI1186567.1 hypothetical protein [Hymenobacter cyanobacteriorum]